MGWSGIERNRMDFILTDLLPVELSELFSFTPFYSFLLRKEQQKVIEHLVDELKKNKAKSNGIMFEHGWGAKPLKYNILKGANSTREMSIVHPFSALNLFLFMECYQKDILNFFDENHCFSIRYHKKSTDLFYKAKTQKVTQYFQKQTSRVGKGVIQQAGNYFRISPFESINAFADSRIWRMCNFKYRYYAKMDYKSCFDSIYSHAYKWIIERNVIDSKEAKNSHLFITIDRILQNINGLSSNGLIVGPEFSRMVAEVLLQHIDREIMFSLSNDGVINGKDYSIFRYVDDMFLYANEQGIIDKVFEKYRIIGEKYLLRLNELKLMKGETPSLPKEWLEKTRWLSDVIGSFFYQGKKADYDKLPDDEHFLIKTDFISVDRIKDEITVLMKKYPEDRRTIVSFLLSTLLNNISKKKDGYSLFGKQKFGKALLLLDMALYIYVFYPSFDQTRKIISMIVYMDSEINFRNDYNSGIKLKKTLHRYSFVFQSGNLFDLCDWFSFFREYNIALDAKTEDGLVQKAIEYNDPIIWGNLLLYSQYHKPFFNKLRAMIETIIEKQVSRISNKDPFLQIEFWYVLIFHNCPYISSVLRNKMSVLINNIKASSAKQTNSCKPSLVVMELVCDFLQLQSSNGNKPEESFFNWKGSTGVSEQITYRTYQRTIFKRYRKNKYGLYASLD
ncbi:MAG: RNA-directed DNA polymerase [Lacrimispora sp.]|uniref:RNA-directed DNA polymerase n=1 Tax=Lacrimispora sp. TaxID=2719234 RepID=UPI0039E261FC